MSETDFSQRARKVKTKLIPGHVCSREEIIEAFGITDRTWTKWRELGLFGFNAHTAEDVYFVDDVFEFLRKEQFKVIREANPKPAPRRPGK